MDKAEPDVREDSAQDVVDAMRFALMAQDEPREALKLVKCLLDFAPETADDRGVKMLLDMICEGTLKVALT